MPASINSTNTGWQNLAVFSGPGSTPISGNSAARTVITHDFGIGSWSRLIVFDAATMRLGNVPVINQWTPGGRFYLGTWYDNGAYIPNPTVNALQRGVTGGHSVLLDLKGAGNPADFDVNFTDAHQTDGLQATRVQYINTLNNFEDKTITGPYTLAYSAPGQYDPTFVLHSFSYNPGSGFASYQGGNNYYTGTPSTTKYWDAKRFYIDLRQKSIPIVRKDSATGTILTDGQNVTGMDTISNNVIALNKASTRKQSVATSYFEIKKQTPTSGYVTATPGVDYNLGGGESLTTSDTIHVTWLTAGNYRVVLVVDDTTYQPQARSEVNFSVGASTENTIVFPDVFTSVAESGVFTNVVTSESPLIGYADLEVVVTAVLDTSQASWIQQIDANPEVTLVLSDADWKEEMTSRLTVRCYVKQNGVVHQLADGFGPHTFLIPQGAYEVGFLVVPKVVTAIDLDEFEESVL